jgi:hypothetical protein
LFGCGVCLANGPAMGVHPTGGLVREWRLLVRYCTSWLREAYFSAGKISSCKERVLVERERERELALELDYSLC